MNYIIVGLLFVAHMMSPSSAAQSTQKGDFVADGNNEGWSLGAGTGSRTHIIFVKFTKPFDAPPVVMLSLTGHSSISGKDGQINLGIATDKVTNEGFVIKVSTWGDTKVYAVYGSWIAIGK